MKLLMTAVNTSEGYSNKYLLCVWKENCVLKESFWKENIDCWKLIDCLERKCRLCEWKSEVDCLYLSFVVNNNNNDCFKFVYVSITRTSLLILIKKLKWVLLKPSWIKLFLILKPLISLLK